VAEPAEATEPVESRALSLPSIVLVTGTTTGVGKTVATAALAGMLLARGSRVAVYKPAQTGVGPDEPGDVDEVCRLLASPVNLTVREGIRLRDPLAPSAAARRESVPIPSIADHARTVVELAGDHHIVLVEGAGGLLVELDARGGTLADLGRVLRYQGRSCGAVLVAAAGLGTLNHTALTAEALRTRELPLLGVVVGAWPVAPAEPDLAMTENLLDLPRIAGAPLLGILPDGSGALDPPTFARGIPEWLSVR